MLIALAQIINPTRLTGPILDKELRVSSRRRRNYFLRFAYLALLSIFIIIVWLTVQLTASVTTAFQISRLAVIGASIVQTIIWFQFIGLQLIAVVMLSSAISDEIRQRTLGVLLSTSITSPQIVLGKLFSKLLQLITLLALSLPILALVRVFGGVPWQFVIAGLCVTLTAALFAASLSLLLSVTNRSPHKSITSVVALLLILYLALPALISLLWGYCNWPTARLETILTYANPFITMLRITVEFMTGLPTGSPSYSWPLHCLTMTAAAALILALTIVRVRRAALRSAYASDRAPRRSSRKTPSNTPITRVTGSPIIWKDLRPKRSRFQIPEKISRVFPVTIVLVAYALGFAYDILDEMVLPSIVSAVLIFFGTLRCAVASATSIVREKEARAWPILLTTPIDDSRIIKHKALAAFRRSTPIWVAFAVNLFLAAIIASTGVELAGHLIISLLATPGPILFVIGMGIYFSARLKTTATAVAATIGIWLGLNYFNPCCVGVNLMVARFATPGSSSLSWFMIFPMISSLVYLGLGVLFLWRAQHNVRRNIFAHK